MSYGSNILGGFSGTLFTSDTYDDGTATVNVGVAARVTPALDPNNINVRGTGERGLYDILLGMRDPRITIDFLPTETTFIANHQSGITAIPFLHMRFGATDGVTFVGCKVNRASVEAKHNAAVAVTMELWAGGDVDNPSGIIWWNLTPPTHSWGTRRTTPYRWLDTVFSVGGDPETAWDSWRYEVVNNLQRLGNVATGGTRDLKARQRDVTGQLVADLEDFAEFGALADLNSEASTFNITAELDGLKLLNCDYCRWGRLEAPFGPEDLIMRRFPFTATDLTTLTP